MPDTRGEPRGRTAVFVMMRVIHVLACVCRDVRWLGAPVALLCLATGVLSGQAVPGTPAERVFNVTGVVASGLQNGTIRIAHEDIPGFMPAMTMPFYVSDPAEAAALQPGDVVEFKFTVGEQSRASAFKVLRRAVHSSSSVAAQTPPAAAAQKRLKKGDVLALPALTTQAGAPLSPSYFDEGYTVLTFVFTRCPVPEFCPLMMKRFQELGKQLDAQPDRASRTRLLVVTIDPEHDTPEVLRKYGEALGADFGRWTFVTGDPAAIGTLEKAFAVRVEPNAGSLDHTLATAVLAPGGRVVEIFRGNGWKTGEVLDALKAAGP